MRTAALPRLVEREILDFLPAAAPEARRARADLRRINALMRTGPRIAAELRARLPRERAPRIADLGAGDGRQMLSIARRVGRPDARIFLVDRAAPVSEETLAGFRRLGCAAEVAAVDAVEFLSHAAPELDAVVANLFLHHLEDDRLGELLLAASRRAPLFVACEPRRGGTAMLGCRLLGLVGCSALTRHDARISVRAGFRDGELSALWPGPGWETVEGAAPPFAHLFAARRASR